MATDTHVTYLQFRNLLASRLGDASKVFYTDNILKRYTLETLRCWNSYAGYSRERGTLSSLSSTIWYSLPTYLDLAGTKIRAYNVTDRDVFVDIKCALMEDTQSLTNNAWNGTDQFDLTMCLNAIEKAQNEYLAKTSSIISNASIAVSSPTAGRVGIADTYLDLIRVAFKPTSGSYRALQRMTELEATMFLNSWSQTSATPLQYSKILTPRSAIQLIPIPSSNGTLDILSIQSCTTPIIAASAVTLNVPDDMAFAIKYGALAYLLAQDGEGQDLQRAEYCRQRFDHAIELGKVQGIIQQAFLNNVPVVPIAPTELDYYDIYWQSSVGTPTKLIAVGMNMIGLNKEPLDGSTTVMLDVIRNHPVPTADGDYIQVGREYLGVLLDYAVHIASFMTGEQTSTMELLTNVMEAAKYHNLRLAAQGFDFTTFNITDRKQNLNVPQMFTEDSIQNRNMGNYGTRGVRGGA